eukprot:3155264-Prymnesium_polylepis.1
MQSSKPDAPPNVVLRAKGHGVPIVAPCSQYSLTGQRMQESTLGEYEPALHRVHRVVPGESWNAPSSHVLHSKDPCSTL